MNIWWAKFEKWIYDEQNSSSEYLTSLPPRGLPESTSSPPQRNAKQKCKKVAKVEIRFCSPKYFKKQTGKFQSIIREGLRHHKTNMERIRTFRAVKFSPTNSAQLFWAFFLRVGWGESMSKFWLQVYIFELLLAMQVNIWFWKVSIFN